MIDLGDFADGCRKSRSSICSASTRRLPRFSTVAIHVRGAGAGCHLERDARLDQDIQASERPHVVLADRIVRDAARTRDAEAQMMNARLFQWRYGAEYGRVLFSRTAAGLDVWRQP